MLNDAFAILHWIGSAAIALLIFSFLFLIASGVVNAILDIFEVIASRREEDNNEDNEKHDE